MHISSSVSASPMHWNLNSFRDSANFLFAVDKSAKDVIKRCVKRIRDENNSRWHNHKLSVWNRETCTWLWKLCAVWVFQDIRLTKWVRVLWGNKKKRLQGENVQERKLRRDRMSPKDPKNKYCLSWNENLAAEISL